MNGPGDPVRSAMHPENRGRVETRHAEWKEAARAIDTASDYYTARISTLEARVAELEAALRALADAVLYEHEPIDTIAYDRAREALAKGER